MAAIRENYCLIPGLEIGGLSPYSVRRIIHN